MRGVLLLLLLCFIGGVSPVRAADPGGATSAPTADNTPLRPASVTPEARQQKAELEAANCPERPPIAEGAPSTIVVELDPDTLWRPRGAEVRFTIRTSGGAVAVSKVRVCFGWSSPDGIFRKSQGLIGSPQVRSVTNTSGVVEYGAVLANLPPVPNRDWWPRRVFASTPYIFTGGFTVPVTDMVVEVTTGAGPPVVTATQVGVTDAVVAWAVVLVIAGILYVMMDRIARYRGIKGRNLALRVVSTRDGYASLSQLQILLWTLVVGLSAIYVMTLSGNLISISDGTLVLLGIASASALAARIPLAGPPAPDLPAPVPAEAPPVAAVTPEWSDLIIPDRASQEIDVTRLQMLAFTLITAAFVAIKVVVDYEIPTIPANFLVLMGISNGVYVGGRRLPSQPKNGGIAPPV